MQHLTLDVGYRLTAQYKLQRKEKEGGIPLEIGDTGEWTKIMDGVG